MATDLVTHFTRVLTPGLVDELAPGLGAGGNQVQSALHAAVPALLAALAGVVAEGRGAELAGAINSYRAGAALPGDDGSPAGQRRLLVTLLGPNMLTAIAASVSKYSGVGQSEATTLLGALTPVVLDVLGEQAGPGASDAAQLGQLFAAQRSTIARALPERLASLLEGSEVLEAVRDTASTAPDRNAGQAARRAPRRAAGRAAGRGWLYWLLPLVVLAGCIWFVGRAQQAAAAEAAADAPTMLPG